MLGLGLMTRKENDNAKGIYPLAYTAQAQEGDECSISGE